MIPAKKVRFPSSSLAHHSSINQHIIFKLDDLANYFWMIWPKIITDFGHFSLPDLAKKIISLYIELTLIKKLLKLLSVRNHIVSFQYFLGHEVRFPV